MTRALLIMVLLAGLLVGQAEAAGSPGRAAVAARDCLRSHGWTAVLADGGVTVDARAPRRLPSYPGRPWFSVSFYRDGDGVSSSFIRMGLNSGELHVAAACRRAAQR